MDALRHGERIVRRIEPCIQGADRSLEETNRLLGGILQFLVQNLRRLGETPVDGHEQVDDVLLLFVVGIGRSR